MSELLISYDGLASNGQRDGLWWGYQPTFDVRAGHDRVTVAARMTTEMRDECLGHLNRDRPAAGAVEEVSGAA